MSKLLAENLMRSIIGAFFEVYNNLGSSIPLPIVYSGATSREPDFRWECSSTSARKRSSTGSFTAIAEQSASIR